MTINVVSLSGEHYYVESGVQVAGAVSVSISGQPVTISGNHVFVESGVYIASGANVVVQSGVYVASGLYVVADIAESGMGVQVQSGLSVIVQSGVYVASGLYVVADIAESGMGVQVQSGLSVIVQSGVYVASGLMVDSGTLASESAVTLLRRIVKLLEPSATQDQYQRQRILVDSMSGAILSTVAAVTTVTNVGAAGIYGNNPVLATSASGGAFVSAYWHGVWTGPVENRWFMMDQSRATYAAQIRKNIWVV